MDPKWLLTVKIFYKGLNKMRIQMLPQTTNFNGKLVLINPSDFYSGSDEVASYLNEVMSEKSNKVIDMVALKPYDVFISKSRQVEGFYEVNANVRAENLPNTQAKPTFIFFNKPERIIDAIKEAMHKYEITPNYSIDTKPDNFFKILFKLIFKKG